MHVRFGGCPRAPARETRALPTRPLATVWGCGVIFFLLDANLALIYELPAATHFLKLGFG